jgi:hypothetical protein
MANRYWVGGTGTWDAINTANWSATSGGAGGESVPTAADAVLFNANSGGGTVTLGVNVDCLTINFSGFTGTFDFSTYDVNVAGNAATIINVTSTIAAVNGTGKFNCLYAGSTGTRTVIVATAAIAKAASVSVSAGTDTLTLSSTNQIINLDFTGFAGTWTTTTTVNIYRNLTLSTGMTVGSLGATIVMAAVTTGNTITSNGKTIDNNINFNGVGGAWTLQDALVLGATRTVSLNNGTILLGNNNLTCGLFASAVATARGISTTGGQIYCVSNNATIFNVSTATNLTITGNLTVNCTYSGSTGTRQINAGGATTYSASNPKLNFNITAGTDIVSLGGGNVFGNVNFTGFTGSYAFTATDPQFFGDLTFGTGMTGPSSATRSLRLMGTSGTQTITSNGVTINSGITCEGGGTYSFADALTQGATNTFAFTLGTVKLKNGVTSTVGVFSASGTTQKYLQSTLAGSQATLSQASGTVSVSSLTIQDINATGGASWNAYVDFDNEDAGNNDGWNFGLSPPFAAYEPPIIIRSFTQPRRF